MTEKQWQAVIVEAAQYLGFTVYHTEFSIRSSPGFPDLILAKPPRLVVIECKAERGKVTPAQERWLSLFAAVPGVTAVCARPSDWPCIEKLLKSEE
jgi:hypothetical protein